MNFDKLANKHKIKAGVIKDEYDKYWKQVKKELTFPEQLKVGIPFFGSFVIQENRIKRKVYSLEKIFKYNEGKTLSVKEQRLREDYINQLKRVCHLLKNILTEEEEVCQICHRLLKQVTTPS